MNPGHAYEPRGLKAVITVSNVLFNFACYDLDEVTVWATQLSHEALAYGLGQSLGREF